jgi:hypothetical protein
VEDKKLGTGQFECVLNFLFIYVQLPIKKSSSMSSSSSSAAAAAAAAAGAGESLHTEIPGLQNEDALVKLSAQKLNMISQCLIAELGTLMSVSIFKILRR